MSLKPKRKDGKEIKYINPTVLKANLQAMNLFTYTNRLSTSINTFSQAAIAQQLRDISRKIREIHSLQPSLNQEGSEERLISCFSTIESVLILFANTLKGEATEGEKESIRELLSGHEIPTLIGTAIVEVSLLWNHIDYW